MNPLIVLEKKYIEKYNFGCAVVIAFLKENGGIYIGTLSKMANDLGILSSTGVVKAERHLERKGIITSKKNNLGKWQYILNIDCDDFKPKKYIEEDVDIITRKSKKRPLKEALPLSVMRHVDALKEIREKKEKNMQ